MGFLRRLLGGEAPDDPDAHDEPADAGGTATPDTSTPEDDERQHELELLRGEQERLDDLAQRQLRYAEYAWQPPPQGGEKRADDGDDPST